MKKQPSEETVYVSALLARMIGRSLPGIDQPLQAALKARDGVENRLGDVHAVDWSVVKSSLEKTTTELVRDALDQIEIEFERVKTQVKLPTQK